MLRKGLIVLLVFVVAFFVSSLIKRAIFKQKLHKPTTVLVVEPIKDLGTIVYGEQKKLVFNLRNVGDNKLFIEKISATCGCTMPELPEAVVEAGETCRLEVIFNTEGLELGFFSKKVHVFTNDTSKSPHQLTIRGNVVVDKK